MVNWLALYSFCASCQEREAGAVISAVKPDRLLWEICSDFVIVKAQSL